MCTIMLYPETLPAEKRSVEDSRRAVDRLMEYDRKLAEDFTVEELRRLFLSVEWSSGHYPDKLKVAMTNFRTVFSAWDDEKLIGMICAMDDGVMNAYVHYLLVDPAYQGLTVGRTLVDMVKKHYKDYLRIAVIAYNEELHFYENCGFEKADDASPMFITTPFTCSTPFSCAAFLTSRMM